MGTPAGGAACGGGADESRVRYVGGRAADVGVDSRRNGVGGGGRVGDAGVCEPVVQGIIELPFRSQLWAAARGADGPSDARGGLSAGWVVRSAAWDADVVPAVRGGFGSLDGVRGADGGSMSGAWGSWEAVGIDGSRRHECVGCEFCFCSR